MALFNSGIFNAFVFDTGASVTIPDTLLRYTVANEYRVQSVELDDRIALLGNDSRLSVMEESDRLAMIRSESRVLN